jgi:hypothetical protein
MQTSGASARVKIGSDAWGAAAGSLDCDATSAIWTYEPSQAETNAESFIVAVYKTGCVSISRTVVPSANPTAGLAQVGGYATGQAPLQPLVAGRQIAVSATTGKVTAEAVVLDSASRLAIWNTLTTETFTADSFGELLLISDGTNGRAVKVTGANHIAADVHDCQADGLSGSTEIANIQDAAGWLLAIGSGAVANPQTSTEQYDITQFGVNYRVAMAGLTSTGTRTAPTLSKP